MKITETIERECCDPGKDFGPNLVGGIGTNTGSQGVRRCKHCLQLWAWVSSIDASVGKDWGWERVKRIEVVT